MPERKSPTPQTVLPCIVCGHKPEPVDHGPQADVVNQPYGATVFDTHGQYGSTVFDPIDAPECLEINVCDMCLRERKDRVLLRVDTRRVESKYEWWEPDEAL